MKKLSILMALLFVSFGTVLFAQDSTKTFKVYGNCESCKARIEKAAKAAGATMAEWSEETKLIAVSFDSKATTSDKIQQKIASVGHDTEKYQALKSSYNKLPGCCKYERETADTGKH